MDKIEIKGYKSIESLSLGLNPINVLIGANGSGKSNFLSFFEFLKMLYIQNLGEYVALNCGGVDKFLFEGRKTTDSLSAHLYFEKNGYSFVLKPGDDNFIFTKEGLLYNHNPYVSNPMEITSLGAEANAQLTICF